MVTKLGPGGSMRAPEPDETDGSAAARAERARIVAIARQWATRLQRKAAFGATAAQAEVLLDFADAIEQGKV